ncbi:(3R)-3-[(carboxymethyl)amino]fatty acid oxygenase/decarboxylase-like, partial [Ruditapes philippinarum]|uniref:(3R)-3-[(carboxymethyl)amino]fatty acid oxygenase/decarboxylase-like n=1 Tax=Ruditapes philippinarum TaxID=129788 RepID=UPI00295B1A68
MEISQTELGVEVRGFRITEQSTFSDKMFQNIKKFIIEHRIVIFGDREKHAEITRRLGIINGALFKEDRLYFHSKCPHPDVYRISNDPEEGCTNVGRSGWHIDSCYLHDPFKYSLYHVVDVPKTGAT